MSLSYHELQKLERARWEAKQRRELAERILVMNYPHMGAGMSHAEIARDTVEMADALIAELVK